MKKKIGSILVVCILISVFGLVVISSAVQLALSSLSNDNDSGVNLDGLPPFITVEMVEALLEMQGEYGHPASTGLAQIIAESGFSYYGPGGENGQGLSQLAYEHKNLFGIKWFAGDEYAIGSFSYSTGEQSPNGENHIITASFSVYASYTDCIKQRAWMLEHSPYIEHIAPYKKRGDGAYSQDEANYFMEGIKEAGWATSLSYVEHCVSLMQTYNLYRFDNMTLEGFQNSQNNGSGGTGNGEEYNRATAAQRHIVDTAYATPFVGDGMCATWVSRVFANAGQPYPTGNANSFSMSRESGELKVGMVICTEHSGADYESWNFGHIGIYIGDNKVMHNESSSTGTEPNGCTVADLDAWKLRYEYQCTAYYGWVNGIDLSSQ